MPTSIDEILEALSDALGERILQTGTLRPEKVLVQVDVGAHRDAVKVS
jgi:hypothetical protein